jgi:hypothetical protein
MKKLVSILILSIMICSSAYAMSLRIITPYLGTINNDMSRTVEGSPEKLILDDDSLMKGLYFQSINTSKFQWNVFLYNSEDLNYSSLWGVHFIYDRYFGVKEKSKYVVGIGIEYITMKTETDDIIPFSSFELSQNIYVPYLRAGKYFYFGDNKIRYSLMPWVGVESDIVRGDIDFTIPAMYPGMPDIVVSKAADEDSYYAMAGLNFKITFYHFIDLKLKYHGKFDLEEDNYFDIASSMLNIYFNRNWGVSYRAKYMKSAEMENIYHIAGIIYAF